MRALGCADAVTHVERLRVYLEPFTAHPTSWDWAIDALAWGDMTAFLADDGATTLVVMPERGGTLFVALIHSSSPGAVGRIIEPLNQLARTLSCTQIACHADDRARQRLYRQHGFRLREDGRLYLDVTG